MMFLPNTIKYKDTDEDAFTSSSTSRNSYNKVNLSVLINQAIIIIIHGVSCNEEREWYVCMYNLYVFFIHTDKDLRRWETVKKETKKTASKFWNLAKVKSTGEKVQEIKVCYLQIRCKDNVYSRSRRRRRREEDV